MRTAILALAAALAIPVALSAQQASDIADGARVWSSNCTRCHNARPSQERTDEQWRTIVLHMRARANLTRADAKLVTTFLQATNAPEPAAAAREASGNATPMNERVGTTGTESSPPDLATLIAYLRTLSSVL